MKKRTIMKKMLSVGLVGAMVLSLAACGSSSSGDSEEASGDSGDGVTLEFQQWWV